MPAAHDRQQPTGPALHTGALDLGLLRACQLIGAEPEDARCARPNTNSVLPARTRHGRVVLRSERLLDRSGVQRKVEAVEALRAQGVPWAEPLEIVEVPQTVTGTGAAPAEGEVLVVTVWAWVERAAGAPHPIAVRDAFTALHGASIPDGLTPRFGSLTADVVRVPELAGWADRLTQVEQAAAAWTQDRVVHGDPLSVNVLHRHDGTVCFIDVDLLAVGHPLADWQYLARDSRVDPAAYQVDWALPSAVLDELVGGYAEPGWQHGDHPLWQGQRLVHLWRRVALWRARGCPAQGVAHLERLAATI